MIRASGLIKRFGAFTAIAGVDLEIREGECFGLLGPNGAGKSTFISMIYGAARRTAGDLSVFGLDPSTQARDIKRRVGVVTQVNALDDDLTVRENMELYACFAGVPKARRAARVEELLAYMSLAAKADEPIQALSGGMQRRLVFVRALLNDPDLLILDEPTTGLDPAVRHLLWAKVKDLRARGATILLTTHYMHEAEILCDRVAVIDKGRRLALGTPRELIESHCRGSVGVFAKTPDAERLLGEAAADPKLRLATDGSDLLLRAPRLEELAEVAKRLRLEPLQLRPANLEDVFLALTGRDLDADA